jgi:hypothetical protein
VDTSGTHRGKCGKLVIAKFTELRVLVTLRRIAKAMERANELELHRQQMEYPPIKDSPDVPKKVSISRPSVNEWNEREGR